MAVYFMNGFLSDVAFIVSIDVRREGRRRGTSIMLVRPRFWFYTLTSVLYLQEWMPSVPSMPLWQTSRPPNRCRLESLAHPSPTTSNLNTEYLSVC